MDVEFWRMKTVSEKVGLSKTEIYRRMKAGSNPFPRSRSYRSEGNAKFWLSTDVRAWQQAELYGALDADEAALLG